MKELIASFPTLDEARDSSVVYGGIVKMAATYQLFPSIVIGTHNDYVNFYLKSVSCVELAQVYLM